MSMASVQSSSPVPTVTHAASEAGALEEKVAVRNLNFFYGGNRALKDVNVHLYAKKVTAFIGPSGCGKSTLLRILNRVYDLYPNQRAEGEVTLELSKGIDRFQASWDLKTGICTLSRITGERAGVEGGKQVVVLDSKPTRLKAPGEYDLRFANISERLTVWVDGTEVLDERIQDIDLPALSLQGSWGGVGDEIEFTDVAVRAPYEAMYEGVLHAKARGLLEATQLRDEVRRHGR